MKTNAELQDALTNISAHLDKNPKSSVEWRTIADQLGVCLAYASKCADMRNQFESHAWTKTVKE